MGGRNEIRKPPPVVGQGTQARCWAAGMESWLRAVTSASGARSGKHSETSNVVFGPISDRKLLAGYPWMRRSRTMQELIDEYTGMGVVQDNQSLSQNGIELVAAENGMSWGYVEYLNFHRDYLAPKLSEFGHLMIAYFSQAMYHVNIAYGVFDGGLLVMNPSGGGSLTELTYDFLRDPKRVNRNIFVGWPLKGEPWTLDHSVASYLPGEWHVLIGPGGSGRSGYFKFESNNTMSWRTFDQTALHPGTWKLVGNTVTWSFSDDAAGWVRTFKISVPDDGNLPDRIDGTATTPQGTMGLFTMTRADD